MHEPGKRVAVGRVAGIFGVQGWVKVHSYTEPREAIFDYRPWLLLTEQGERTLESRLREVALAHDMVVCGPNCMGFVSPGRRLPVSGYPTAHPTAPGSPAGRVSLITHSGSVFDALPADPPANAPTEEGK